MNHHKSSTPGTRVGGAFHLSVDAICVKKESVLPISPSRHNSVSAEVPGARPGQDPRRLRTAQPSRVGPKSHVGWRVSLGRAATTGSQVPLATQQDKCSREPIYEEELEAVLRAKEVGSGECVPHTQGRSASSSTGWGPRGSCRRKGEGGVLAEDQRDTRELGTCSPAEPTRTCLGPATVVALEGPGTPGRPTGKSGGLQPWGGMGI